MMTNLHVLWIPIYVTVGVSVIRFINRRSFNIYKKMDDVGWGFKIQGMITLILVSLWPILCIFIIQGYVQSLRNTDETGAKE